jgi:pimeloyl-ACP methyl ester carboxylesterase
MSLVSFTIHDMRKYLDWQGGKIYVQSHGRTRKHVLLLLHGFCEDHTIWDGLITGLTDMRVVTIDLPGFGRSTPIKGGLPQVSTYAQAVLCVLDSLKLGQVTIIGHSLGGYIALKFADLFPARLTSFGLINSHPLPDSQERKLIRDQTIGLLRSGKQRMYVKQLFSGLFEPSFAQSNLLIIQNLVNQAAKMDVEGIVYALGAMRDRPDQKSVLTNSSCPVLILLGELDTLIPNEIYLQFIHLPEVATIHLLRGVAHMSMLEDLKTTSRIIQSFIISHS